MGDIDGLLPPQLPKLRRYARSLTQDKTDAEDLVQRCLVRALSGSICGASAAVFLPDCARSCTTSSSTICGGVRGSATG